MPGPEAFCLFLPLFSHSLLLRLIQVELVNRGTTALRQDVTHTHSTRKIFHYCYLFHYKNFGR